MESRFTHAQDEHGLRIIGWETKGDIMKLRDKIQETGATGYILLWLLGVPIPILLLFFLLRGCT